MSERTLGVYEMFWDCEYCSTKGLLAKTNKHCPACGAPQDADRRYFPPDGKEVEVHNHAYDGADKLCVACKTANGAKANNCRNCGNALDGAKAVELKPQGTNRPTPKGKRPAVTAAPPPKSTLPYKIGAVAGVILLLILVTVFWKKEVKVAVHGHTWERTIEVERFGPKSESEWCTSMPHDAYSVRRSREVRSHKDVPDGQECHVEKKDRGDGTYEKKEVCKTKYRKEPIYDDKCHYTVDRWQHGHTERAAGSALTPAPAWPAVNLARTGTCHGCEREGPRNAHYWVELQAAHEHYRCDVGEGPWPRYQVGDALPLKVRVVTGGADCDSIHPLR